MSLPTLLPSLGDAGTEISSATLFPLCQLPIGARACVRTLRGDGDFCQRVREMGFGESAVMRKISGRGPFVCEVNGTRIALSHAAASCILVEPAMAG